MSSILEIPPMSVQVGHIPKVMACSLIVHFSKYELCKLENAPRGWEQEIPQP